MPLVSVTIPTTTNSSKTINVNSDVQFVTDVGSGGVPRTCQTILQRARQDGKPGFFDIYKLNKLKDTFISLNSQLTDSTLQTTSNLTSTDLQQYLTVIETSNLPVLRLVNNCLSEEIKIDEKTLKEAKEAHDTSKARFESIDEDHEYVGYYESWFPLQRHVKENNLFFLFGVSVFLLILSILTFLHLAGIEFKFILPNIESTSGYSFDTYQPYLLGGAMVGILFVGIGLWIKWF